MKEFLIKYGTEIIISSAFILVCIGLLLFLSITQHRKKGIIGSVFVLFILAALNYILIINFDKSTYSIIRLILFNLALLVAYVVILLEIFKKESHNKEKITTTKVALMGILVGVASVVMMFGIPVFPPAPYLKLELSGLIIFMVFLWFDYKSAIIVSLLTNFIHVFMPTGSAPIIPFLDEGINFIATMAFMLPSILFLKGDGKRINNKKMIVLTFVGIAFTTVFMVLYNAFFNLPFIYEIKMPLKDVIKIFGLFNLLKWGAVALAIVLLWKKLYILKDIRSDEQKELTKH